MTGGKTMYINPFICGTIVGAVGMAVVLITASFILYHKNKPRR